MLGTKCTFQGAKCNLCKSEYDIIHIWNKM